MEGDEAVAEVVQNAGTGRVLSVSYIQVDGSDEGADGDSPWDAVPGSGALVLLALSSAAVLVGRGRSS